MPDFKEKQLAYLFSHTPKTNMHKYVKLQIGVKCINIHLKKNEKDSKAEKTVNNRDKSDFSISNSICQKTHDRKNP